MPAPPPLSQSVIGGDRTAASKDCSLACCCDARCENVRCDNRKHSLFPSIEPEDLKDALTRFLLSVDFEEHAQDKHSEESVLAAGQELYRNTRFQDKISAVAQDVQTSLDMLRQRQAQIEADKAQAVVRMDFHDAEAVRRVSL